MVGRKSARFTAGSGESAVGALGWRLHDFYGVEGGHFGLYLVADDRRAPGFSTRFRMCVAYVARAVVVSCRKHRFGTIATMHTPCCLAVAVVLKF